MSYIIQRVSCATLSLLLTGGIAFAQADTEPQPVPDPQVNQGTSGAENQDSEATENAKSSGSEHQPAETFSDPTAGTQQFYNATPEGSSSSTAVPSTIVSAGPVYLLRFDSYGREFICVNGMRVYFDVAQSMSPATQMNTDDSERYRAGFANPDNDDFTAPTADPNAQSDENDESEQATASGNDPTDSEPDAATNEDGNQSDSQNDDGDETSVDSDDVPSPDPEPEASDANENLEPEATL